MPDSSTVPTAPLGLSRPYWGPSASERSPGHHLLRAVGIVTHQRELEDIILETYTVELVR